MHQLTGFGAASTAAIALSVYFSPCAAVGAFPLEAQKPLLDSARAKEPHKLHGRFLHLTDFHPDAFYKAHSSTAAGSACHSGDGSAGYYGAETSDCDSPITLVNATFDWIADNLRDKIDFIIWTGDSARHDNDEDFPRSTKQVEELNTFMVSKFDEVFGRERDNKDPYDDYIVPIVPTLGNNDILPHNIFDVGPNDWTRAYLDIWKGFIPELERHEFDQSGWFAVEVIPGYLTAFSLNTLYFFDKNAAVDGCSLRGEPGYRQMEWLRVQLQFLREKGHKAILSGHVPPARTDGKMNWDETCWQKYALWMRQYRDVIVGTFYGHMNVDHFILQDFDDINHDLDNGYGIEKANLRKNENSLRPFGAASYMTEMRAAWAQLPKKPKGVKVRLGGSTVDLSTAYSSDDARPSWEIEAFSAEKKKKKKHKKSKKGKKYVDSIGGEHAERFGLSFVSPSIVPNFYPTLRIYEYNTTGVDYHPPTALLRRPIMNYDVEPDIETETKKNKKKKKKKKDKEKKRQRKRRRFTVPQPPSKSAPPGPAYSPQSLSLLRYQQYFANLTYINHDFDEVLAAEGVAFVNDVVSIEGGKWKDGKHKHHNGKKPNKGDGPAPRNFTFEVLYDTREDKVYKLKDLTVRSYLELATRMASGMSSVDQETSTTAEDVHKTPKVTRTMSKKEKMNKIWYAFVDRAFVCTKSDEELRESFGD
ncbi:hypothetical protein ANO11243_004010 [Dothideomycetidae sp. 11243]|nr:hypothetical protein ANO11243_004010 [fungal sp. No.11243]